MTVDNRRTATPTMDAIVKHWRTLDLPWLRSYMIGWGEPFCFACGWLPPVRDGRKDSWRLAGKWLDRAHLQDHFYGGPETVENIVPLCHLCHPEMPDFKDRDRALQWVEHHADCDWVWQQYTDHVLCHHGAVCRHTTLLREHHRYLRIRWDLAQEDLPASQQAKTKTS